jgi:hypothetical protein
MLCVPAGGLPILFVLELAGVGAGPHALFMRRILAAWPLALLPALPVLFGVRALYGWAHDPHTSAWLTPLFFDARSVIYILAWCLLAVAIRRPPAAAPRRALCVFGLIATTIISTLAANDWIGSAEPGPDLASLGLLFIASQAVIAEAAARCVGAPPSPVMALAGLCWGFVAFTRFLTAWSADKPSEIVYYQHRQTLAGQGVSWLGFAVVVFSLMTLLPGRIAKLSGLAALLVLVAHAADFLWMVTPASRGQFTVSLPDIVGMLGAAALAAGLIALQSPQGQSA